MEYKYGNLKTIGDLKSKEEGEGYWNPLYVGRFKLEKGKEKIVSIFGEGKILQISFLSTNQSVRLDIKIDDGKDFQTINNGYCLEKISSNISLVSLEMKDEKFLYTFRLPFIFEKRIDIRLIHEGYNDDDAEVSFLHIYYGTRTKI